MNKGELDFTGVDPDIAQKDEKMIRELEALGIQVQVYWECKYVNTLSTRTPVFHYALYFRFKILKKVAMLLRQRKPIPSELAGAINLNDAHEYNEYLANHPTRKFSSLNEVDQCKIERSIFDGTVFGFVKCSVRTPDHLKPNYADYPPVRL